MAFPVIEATATTDGTTASTAPVINLPASIAADELLLVLFRTADGGAVGWPAGWSEMFEDSTDSDDTIAMAWRKADGAEGATITLDTPGNGKFAAIAWRISGADDPTVQPPEFATLVTGAGTTPDPGSLSPTGGAKDYLWLWCGGWAGEQTSPPASTPTNYANALGASSGTAGVTATNCRVASADRELNAASEDPGSWTITASGSGGWTATVVAVHPVGASPDRTGRGYQVYMEVAGFDRTGRVYMDYLEVGSEVRKGRSYQIYLEVSEFDRTGIGYQIYLAVPSPESGTGGGLGDAELVVPFERGLRVVRCTTFTVPRGKQSWGHTGRGQFRAGFSAGRTWTEEYEPCLMEDPRLWAYLNYLNDLAQNERVFEIDYNVTTVRGAAFGTIAGAPVVSGANQSGFTLTTAGWTGTLLRGDIIRVEGMNYALEVVEDVTAGATTDVVINPGILVGGSPDDGAAIVYGADVTYRAKIDNITDIPEVDGDHIFAGLRVTFREAP